MNIRAVYILGGTGFVGQHLVSRLSTQGYKVTVATRNPQRHRHLQVLPDLQLRHIDIHDASVLEQEFAGHQAVINLVGILNERGRKGKGFRRVHVELTQKVIDTCRKLGIRRLLHMSALNASSASGRSYYLRTKGEAENLVNNANRIDGTIFRPSVIFGAEDSFMNRFAGLLSLMPILPLACPKARFAPVYVGDVTDHMAALLEDEDSIGQSYDLCGGRHYALNELVEYAAKVRQQKRWIVNLPDWASRLQARTMEFVPGKPLSMDNYYSLQSDSLCACDEHSFPCLPCPTTLESIVPEYLGTQGRDAEVQRQRSSARR